MWQVTVLWGHGNIKDFSLMKKNVKDSLESKQNMTCICECRSWTVAGEKWWKKLETLSIYLRFAIHWKRCKQQFFVDLMVSTICNCYSSIFTSEYM